MYFTFIFLSVYMEYLGVKWSLNTDTVWTIITVLLDELKE